MPTESVNVNSADSSDRMTGRMIDYYLHFYFWAIAGLRMYRMFYSGGQTKPLIYETRVKYTYQYLGHWTGHIHSGFEQIVIK